MFGLLQLFLLLLSISYREFLVLKASHKVLSEDLDVSSQGEDSRISKEIETS
jgi:hypothetical protein